MSTPPRRADPRRDKKTLILTFNVKAKDELKARGLTNTDVKTYTSFAYEIYKKCVRAELAEANIMKNKAPDTMDAIVCDQKQRLLLSAYLQGSPNSEALTKLLRSFVSYSVTL